MPEDALQGGATYTGRTIYLEKETWSGTDLDNKSLPSISMARLTLASKIVTVNNCYIDRLHIKKLNSRVGSHLQFVNCEFSGSLSIHGFKGISGLSLRNCTIDGDLVLHDLDGLADKASICLERSTVRGDVKLSSICCDDIRLVGSIARSLQMDQSEVCNELSLIDGTAVRKGLAMNASRNALLRLKGVELGGECIIAAASGCNIAMTDVHGGDIRLISRHDEALECTVKIGGSIFDVLFAHGLKSISGFEIDECSFVRQLSFSDLTWSGRGVLSLRNIGECGRLSLLDGAETPPAAESADAALPATLDLCELSPRTTDLDEGYVEFLEQRLRGPNADAIGNILENHYARAARYGDVDRIRYRVKINNDKSRIRNGSKIAVIKLALFGYAYGYGFRIANQVYTGLISSLVFAMVLSLTANAWSSWFFAESVSSAWSSFLEILLLVVVGTEGAWFPHTQVSWQGALAITSFRTVVFLSLSGAIVRKIGRG